MRRPVLILGVALWAAVALAGLGAGALYLSRGGPEPVGAGLGGPFALTDQHGQPVTEAAFEGQPNLLFFGFTHCPEICPTTVWEMDNWFRELGPEGEELRAWFVTVDPERDTPQILDDYLSPQSDRVTGLSGDPEAVAEMARAWRVFYQKVPLDGGDYTVDHFAGIYMLNDEGQYAGLISYGEPAEEVIPKLTALIEG